MGYSKPQHSASDLPVSHKKKAAERAEETARLHNASVFNLMED
jgi:hypothetical protein